MIPDWRQILLTAAIALAVGIVAPGVAEVIRARLKIWKRKVDATPEKTDDEMYETFAPFFEKIAERAAAGDNAGARTAALDLHAAIDKEKKL